MIKKGIILAGGMGTRISEYTKSVPKPMIVSTSHNFYPSILIIITGSNHHKK